ncbi:MAG: prolipoprotein diacylglyceryl transferase [Lachnospiraceae bacterium]|nr:prolipoprotein diacylglyceryl transferase [Lachnospiraceae bacterium]
MSPGDIAFPNLGILLKDVPREFYVFGFRIALYGCVVGTGILLAVLLAAYDRKRRGLNPETIWDLSTICVICGILGARAYYVVFQWDYYSRNPLKIFNFREGGLAIYGGVIVGFIAVFIYCKLKHEKFLEVFDSVALAFPLGQAVGRWGNFFNREAFGGWFDGLLCMRLPEAAVRQSDISDSIREHMVDGTIYVHPTFLYESIWNISLLIILFFYGKRKRFSGEVFFLYLLGYGIGRFWIEGLRTDQLILPVANMPVSQVVACISAIFALLAIVFGKRVFGKK